MPEIQDIFKLYGREFLEKYKLTRNKVKAIFDILNCRTAALGGHIDHCDNCDYTKISYNSCRNRNCPKCQTLDKERWIAARQEDLLNVGYFHVVFTVPDTLNALFYQNQEVVYPLFFKAISETLTELAADKKYLGAQIGITTVLHTWGQNLHYHPHIHCIVPGGGLTSDGKWINSRQKFFIPVKVISRKFRGKFLYYLSKAKLEFYNSVAELAHPKLFNDFLSTLYKKEWIVYCKPPFKTPSHVLKYLGRYTHRVAISNNRIVKIENGLVSFKWRDYRDNNKQKIMTLTCEEFIRRFLMHVLPSGFRKIRHYGLLSGRNKNTKLKLCKKLTNTQVSNIQPQKLSTEQLLEKLMGKDFTLCPCCGIGKLSRASPLNAIA